MAGFVDNMAGVGFEHTPGPFAQFDDMQLMEMYMDGTLPAEQRIAIRAELRKRDEARLPREPFVQIGPTNLGAAIPSASGPKPLGWAQGWLADAGPSEVAQPAQAAPAGIVAPLGANELSSVPASTLVPPPMGQGMAATAAEPPVADVIPVMQQMAEQLPPEQKQQMLDGMVKMLDTLVVEGEAPAERQEAVSRSAGDQRSEQPAPTSAGPAKPENAPDERTLALAQVYEVAASTGLLTPEALPFSKFVAGFDQLQGVGGQDDQMNRLLAKGEEKKAEFTEAPKEERKGPKISDMEDQMNQLAGYRNSNLGRTGA